MKNSDIFGKVLFFYERFHKVIYITILLERGRLYTNSQKSKKDKENYRPVSILPVSSKIFGRIMFMKMHVFFRIFLTNRNADSVKVITPSSVW